MAYYLNAWIAKKEVFDSLGIECTNLSQGFAITTTCPNVPSDYPKLMAWVSSDYFGGVGEQEAAVWSNGNKICFDPGYGKINAALSLIGVIKTDDNDEFDSLGLGAKRDNGWLKSKEDVFNGDDIPY